MNMQMFFSLFFAITLATASIPREEGSFYDKPFNNVKEICSSYTFYGKLDDQGKPSECYKNCKKPVWLTETGSRLGYQQVRDGVVMHGVAERTWWLYKMINFAPNLLIPFFLYAETHYKFKTIYSRLFKKEPEIIADAPHRAEPGQAIPILLFVKDGHRFPILLKSVFILLSTNTGEKFSQTFTFNQTIKNHKFWHKNLYFDAPEKLSGMAQLDVHIKIKINGTTRVDLNTN